MTYWGLDEYFASEIRDIEERGYHPSSCCNVFKTYEAISIDEKGNPYDSKAGGIPYIAQGDEWPVCPHCGHEQVLLLQLNLQQMPEVPLGLPTQGLIQVFVCYYIPPKHWQKPHFLMQGEHCWGKNWLERSSSAYTVRLIRPLLPPIIYDTPPWIAAYQLEHVTDSEIKNNVERRIEVSKTPDLQECMWSTEEEHRYIGCRCQYRWGGYYLGWLGQLGSYGELSYGRSNYYANLAGYTSEGLGIEYELIIPICPICHHRLKLLFQFNLNRVGSPINLNHHKYGRKALFYCSNHSDVFRVVSYGESREYLS